MRILILSVFMLFSFAAHSASDAWEDLAREDLTAIYKTLKADHPGAVDTENPWFKKQMEDGFKKAKSQLGKVKTYQDYQYVLKEYISGFNDGHLSLTFFLRSRAVPYTGFLVRFQDDRFFIAQSTDASFPVGAELLHCDSKSPKDIMLTEYFPTGNGNPDLVAAWQLYTPFLLQGDRPSWKTPHSICELNVDGKKQLAELHYDTISEQKLIENIRELHLGKDREYSLKRLRGPITWIKFPDFSVEEKDAKKMKEIIKQGKRLRKNKYIVFDLRGNSGGSSLWGDQMLASIYGQEYFDSVNSASTPTYAEFRVSEANYKHLQWIRDYLEKLHGKDSDGYKVFSKSVLNMEKALKEKKDFSRQAAGEAPPEESKSKVQPQPLSQARIVLLTDGFCGSACLDFMDAGLAMPGAIHMGTPTSADTVYMELRFQKLPSEIAQLDLATKVYRNRPRGHNVAYTPQYLYKGNMGDDHALKAWVLKTLLHP